MLEDVEGVMMTEVTLGFIGFIGRWAGGHGNNAEVQQHPRAVRISQHCLKGVTGHNTLFPWINFHTSKI